MKESKTQLSGYVTSAQSAETKAKASELSASNSIPSIEFAETKELGHVNRVDPLGITYLRVRGMWGIKSPFYLFREHFTPNTNAKFTFMMAVNLEKYHSFTNYNKLEELAKTNESLTLTNIKIKNPNNPAKLIPAKLITFEIL